MLSYHLGGTESRHYNGGVPRWEPNPRARLERSAFALFAEQGYHETTVEQIAAGAGLARSTFFRYFRDKREIVFCGLDGLAPAIGASVENAPPEQTPLEAIETSFADLAATSFPAERRDLVPLRAAVVAATPELRERELMKRAGIQAAITAALRSRGVGELAAMVAADLASLTFSQTVAAWAEPGNTEDFGDIARRVLRGLHAAATELK
jgi:AcrR family transcriptional regulator